MSDGLMLVKDNKNAWHIVITDELDLNYPYQPKTRRHPNNRLYRIVDNDFGKIIITARGQYRSNQIILTNTQLFDKKAHIDFAYLKDKYIPALKEVMAKVNKPIVGKANDNMKTSIYLIAENKAYMINDSYGLSDIDRFYTSSELLDSITNSYCDKEEDHGLEFLKKCLLARYNIVGNSLFPVTYINTNNFKQVEFNSVEKMGGK